MLIDPITKVLYIDLGKRTHKVVDRSELFNEYLGGVGVAIKLLQEECPPGIDPLSAANPIILAVGPLSSYYPLASKTVAMFKSPHTGNLGESHCGGRSAIAIRLAGYGAIVIKGASSLPIYLSIDGGNINFRDASTLWGMRSTLTAGRVIREVERGAGSRSIMRIGLAGEQMISYACVTTETYRHFGRLGLGAVFGSKKLKAILVNGRMSLPVVDRKAYRKVYDDLYKAAITPDLMRKYHDLGTPANVLPLNGMGALPTKNLQATRFDGAERISGERMASDFLGRRLACAHCPVGCVHIAALREPYGDEPYFYKTSMISYDYEPIFAVGSLLGGDDVPGMLTLMDCVERYGLDVMSTGVVLAWATEAFDKGLISTKETEGLTLAWGAYKEYKKFIENLIERPNEFYRTLGKGVIAGAKRYGGLEFALAHGGNEMPGYHTGPAAHLGFLLGARHSHLDNGGYSIDQKVLTKRELSPRELVDKLISAESWRQILTSLVICYFARSLYTPPRVVKALQALGNDCSEEELQRIGRAIYHEKYAFKLREGFRFDDLALPERVYETESMLGYIDRTFISEAMTYAKKVVSDEVAALNKS